MKNKRKKPWREFEELVAKIEKSLSGDTAIVKSPDHIPDVVTGDLREVDASIRTKVGSVDVLITVECRNRVAKQDVTWIEQLAEKKKNIGASRTIAVASSGFTKLAIKNAIIPFAYGGNLSYNI